MVPTVFLATGCLVSAVFAQNAGTIEQVGSTLVSAMMMFLGNEEKVYILDKTEGNAAQMEGHPAWGSVWDLASSSAVTLEVETNSFCASGMHLPNGSYVAFGGNQRVSPGPADYNGAAGTVDPTYQDWDGRTAIRIVAPCTGDSASFPANCQWFDNSTELHMQMPRWYSTAEALADGTVVLLGGMTGGGFINRETPVTDPQTQDGKAENTYEFYPAKAGFTASLVQFLVDAGGLNTYTHALLMPSGKIFLQANLITALWDPTTNDDVRLPDMPNNAVRVYPASGATAIMPLTPANNWTPTVLFCGGFDAFSDADWGNYDGPATDPWNFASSTDCQRITPEPADGSAPTYIQDDTLPIARTMGQFVLLPDGTMLIVNGGAIGMAAYGQHGTVNTPLAQMPFGTGFATSPVLTPVIYNPSQPLGSRFSSAGLGASTIPRLYHSTAMLLPDGSVFLAGSNPNPDVNLSLPYPTTYEAEKFYPLYFDEPRPVLQGVPQALTYGGPYFNLTLSNSSYTGAVAEIAANTTVVLIRTGFATHSINMGQRFLQLNNTYSVGADGALTLHVSQVPPNPNLLTPGPVLLFVVVNGVPSIGKLLTVGSGAIGTQPVLDIAELPPASTTPPSNSTATTGQSTASAQPASNTKRLVIIGAAGGAAALALLALVVCFLCRRRVQKNVAPAETSAMLPAPPPMDFIRRASAYESGSQVALAPPRRPRPDSQWSSSLGSGYSPTSTAPPSSSTLAVNRHGMESGYFKPGDYHKSRDY